MVYTSIQWESAALLVIDMQNDFVDGAMAVPGTADVLPPLTELVAAFRSARRPTAHLIRLYEPGSSDVDLVRRADVEAGRQVVAPGTPGADIPPALLAGSEAALDTSTLLAGDPQPLSDREVVMFKPRWSAFYRTALPAWLDGYDITSVVVAGCNLPNCPRATLFDASERDLRTAVVTDAVSQATPERLDDLTLIGVNLTSVADVTQQLTKLAAT